MPTRDYARQQRRPEPARRGGKAGRPRRTGGKAAARKGFPLWAALLLGISMVLLAAAMYSVSRPVAPLAMAPSSEARAGLPKQKVVEIPPKQPSRFDFYEMLPSYEVVVPDEVINPPKPKPGPKTAISTAQPAAPTPGDSSAAEGANSAVPADITSGNTVLAASKHDAPASATRTDAPAATAGSAAKPASPATPAAPATVTRAPPQPTATLAQGERFQVQAAAYRNKADAEEKRAALALSGIAMHIEPASLPNGETWYRVRSGPLGSAAAAAQVQAAVREQGFSAVVVKVQQ